MNRRDWQKAFRLRRPICDARHQTAPQAPRFSLLEVLIVMGLIAFLTAAIVVIMPRLGNASKVAATQATIKKVDELLNDRINGFIRWIQYAKHAGRQQPAELRDELAGYANDCSTRKTRCSIKILAAKYSFRKSFRRISEAKNLPSRLQHFAPQAGDGKRRVPVSHLDAGGRVRHRAAGGRRLQRRGGGRHRRRRADGNRRCLGTAAAVLPLADAVVPSGRAQRLGHHAGLEQPRPGSRADAGEPVGPLDAPRAAPSNGSTTRSIARGQIIQPATDCHRGVPQRDDVPDGDRSTGHPAEASQPGPTSAGGTDRSMVASRGLQSSIRSPSTVTIRTAWCHRTIVNESSPQTTILGPRTTFH